MDKAITTQIKYTREALLNKVSDLIKVYKSTPGVPISTNSVVNLPDSLINFPLYIFCLLKHYVFSISKGVRPDTRSFFFHKLRTMSCNQLLKFIHPHLYPVSFEQLESFPNPVRLTSAELTKFPVFVLDNFIHLYLWIGKTIPTQLIQSLFGVDDYNSIVTNVFFSFYFILFYFFVLFYFIIFIFSFYFIIFIFYFLILFYYFILLFLFLFFNFNFNFFYSF